MEQLIQDKDALPASSASEVSAPSALDRTKLLRIIQAMVDAVVVITPSGQVHFCNPAFEKLFNLRPQSVTGQGLENLRTALPDDLFDTLKALSQAQETGSHEITIMLHRQEHQFLVYTTPIEEQGQVTEVVAVFHDITQVKQTEKMRRDFVANVSHELRTPLTAIHGYAETLLEGALKDEAVVRDFIQIIFNHSQRLSLLVRDLLDLSKLEYSDGLAELHPINLISIIEKVIQLSDKSLKAKNIQHTYVSPQNFPKVRAVETNIEQVVTNLLDNAIKYTPEGGNITIRAMVVDNHVQVDVEDTGIGIDSKHIPRLFERFYRVDKARSRDLGGTGLGLAIVKHIIQLHGGEVWVKSRPGKGSTFSFTLNIVSEDDLQLNIAFK